MEDAEYLVGVDGAEGEIVIGIAPVVEVESAEQVGVQQPRDNLLDVLREIVMAGIDQDTRLRAGLAAQVRRHAPVGNIGVIEGGLKGLVLDEQVLIGSEMVVRCAERVSSQTMRSADALRAGVVGSVSKPKRNIARAETLGDLDGIEHVLECVVADFSVGVAEGAKLVFLILKEIGIDGTGADTETALEVMNLGDILNSIGQIPQDVQGECGRGAGEAMDFGSIAEFLFERGGGGRLDEFSETRAGICKSPRRNFDLECVQDFECLSRAADSEVFMIFCLVLDNLGLVRWFRRLYSSSGPGSC